MSAPMLVLRVGAALCVLLGIAPLANFLSAGPGIPWYRLAVLEWVARGALLLLVAGVASLTLRGRIETWAARAHEALLRISPRTFGLGAALLVAASAVALSWYCFSLRPFTSDEMAQQWHARILLSGRLFAVPEVAREFFNTAPVLDDHGRWFSQYPVGGPAFIAAGLLIGAAWLVNPVLLGLACWCLYDFLRRVFGESLARLVTLLFAISPMVLIMGASQMNHVPALLLVTVALAWLARWDVSSAVRDAWPIGLAVGLMATVRPLDAALVAAVIGAFQLHRAGRQPSRWKSIAVQVAVALLPIAVLLWVNARTTGAPLLFGYDALNGAEHRLGFHLDPNGEMHTPTRGLAFASGSLLRLSRYLFEWPIPGMAVVIAGLLLTRGASQWDVLMAALAAAFIVGYAAYWFDGFFSGPRFLFTAVPAFLVFAAKGLAGITRMGDARLRRTALVAFPVCVLVAWLGPDGVSSARGRARLYHEQRTKLKTDVAGQVERAGISNALVFVNEGWRGRLLARLRVLGASQFRAERLVSSLDACALGDALDDAARLPSLPAPQRLELVVRQARAHGTAVRVSDLPADQAVAIVPGTRPTPSCLAELAMDASGTIPYPPFLALHRIGEDGRVYGDVIFARDLGARNELLRARFGTRRWYHYRPPASLADTANPFVPFATGR